MGGTGELAPTTQQEAPAPDNDTPLPAAEPGSDKHTPVDDARELRTALARAIGALRNACVGAASSTAELLGGEDPTGFAEEVKALADAHERELAAHMVEGEPSFPLAGGTASTAVMDLGGEAQGAGG